MVTLFREKQKHKKTDLWRGRGRGISPREGGRDLNLGLGEEVVMGGKREGKGEGGVELLVS